MNISHLDANTIYLVLLDLISAPKRDLLVRTDCGPRARPHLEAITRRFSAIVQEGKPFAAELAAADRAHDVGSIVLDLICEAHSLLATMPQFAHLAAPAGKVRAALTMGRGHARTSYVNEAAEAARNRAALPAIIDTLRAMPIAPGVTAADVAELFIGGGEELRAYLIKRADVDAAVAAARSGGVTSALVEARGLISRLRVTVESEVSWRDDLDDDLPRRIFSLLDDRLAAAAARTRRSAAAGDAAPPADDEGAGLDGSAPAEDAAVRDADGAEVDPPEADPPALRPIALPDAD